MADYAYRHRERARAYFALLVAYATPPLPATERVGRRRHRRVRQTREPSADKLIQDSKWVVVHDSTHRRRATSWRGCRVDGQSRARDRLRRYALGRRHGGLRPRRE